MGSLGSALRWQYVFPWRSSEDGKSAPKLIRPRTAWVCEGGKRAFRVPSGGDPDLDESARTWRGGGLLLPASPGRLAARQSGLVYLAACFRAAWQACLGHGTLPRGAASLFVTRQAAAGYGKLVDRTASIPVGR